MSCPDSLPPLATGQHRSRGGHGFILLEVLLAMAIFCCVGLGLANALGHAADAMLSSNRESQIRLALQSLLAIHRNLPVELAVKTDPSEDATVTFEHEWTQVKMVNRDSVSLPNLYELSVRAFWKQSGLERKQEAHILIYRPQP